jgi:hypothetical protein
MQNACAGRCDTHVEPVLPALAATAKVNKTLRHGKHY